MSALVYRPHHPAANINGMVPKAIIESGLQRQATGVMADIAPFVTQEGVEITSRSGLRAYEQQRGIRQIGNDWTGAEKPAFWGGTVKRKREI